MISKLFKRTLALTLAAALCISGSTALISSTVTAAKKAKLVTKKNLKLKVGDKKKIKLKPLDIVLIIVILSLGQYYTGKDFPAEISYPEGVKIEKWA